MRFSGCVVREGVPLPPAAGPARQAMLYQDGLKALRQSARLYGQCCRTMVQTLGLDLAQIPSWEATNALIQHHDLRSMEAQRDFLVEVWSRAKRRLRREISRRTYASPLHIVPPALRVEGFDHRQYTVMAKLLSLQPGPQVCDTWRDLESSARESLARAIDAFNFLEETDLAEFSHEYAHKVAALVGGIFGCRFEYSEGAYWDTCPISLMHSRVGMSVGFTATRLCSLCGEELDVCDHLLDTPYEVQVHRDIEGTCNACGRRSCSHSDGEVVLAYPQPVLGDAKIHEVTLVPRPRDPLARITKVEIDPQLLARSLGEEPKGRNLRCFRCLQPCGGFKTPQSSRGKILNDQTGR